ncbi:MAG: hypothetical protein Q8K86_07320 [Candidatus Nanopelagicaceae bacterium]|nr:hypothetical protein [Candidatus Nanopelagicaceae bacterium]
MSKVSEAIDTIIATESLSTGHNEAEIAFEFMRDLHRWMKNGFDEEDIKAFHEVVPPEEREEFLKQFNQARVNYVNKEMIERIDRDLLILGASVGLL